MHEFVRDALRDAADWSRSRDAGEESVPRLLDRYGPVAETLVHDDALRDPDSEEQMPAGREDLDPCPYHALHCAWCGALGESARTWTRLHAESLPYDARASCREAADHSAAVCLSECPRCGRWSWTLELQLRSHHLNLAARWDRRGAREVGDRQSDRLHCDWAGLSWSASRSWDVSVVYPRPDGREHTIAISEIHTFGPFRVQQDPTEHVVREDHSAPAYWHSATDLCLFVSPVLLHNLHKAERRGAVAPSPVPFIRGEIEVRPVAPPSLLLCPSCGRLLPRFPWDAGGSEALPIPGWVPGAQPVARASWLGSICSHCRATYWGVDIDVVSDPMEPGRFDELVSGRGDRLPTYTRQRWMGVAECRRWAVERRRLLPRHRSESGGNDGCPRRWDTHTFGPFCLLGEEPIESLATPLAAAFAAKLAAIAKSDADRDWAETAAFEEVLEAGSLGTTTAKRRRLSVPDEVAERIVARADELPGHEVWHEG